MHRTRTQTLIAQPASCRRRASQWRATIEPLGSHDMSKEAEKSRSRTESEENSCAIFCIKESFKRISPSIHDRITNGIMKFHGKYEIHEIECLP